MEDGWIKIFRLFLDWEWYGDTNMVRLFLHLLLKANYEDKRWQGIVIKRGQLVTSSLTLAAETHLSRQRVRTCLSRLEHTGEISIKTTNKFSVITICKYGNYQAVNLDYQPTNNQQITNNQPTINQQSTNNQPQHKNIRSKEIKNIIDTNVSTSVEDSPDPNSAKEDRIDFAGLLNFFNKTMETSAAVIPKIKSMSERRKSNIRARVREYSKRAVFEVITKAGASDFLNGKNKNGWVADFDWIFRPNNFPKVLEGNYDNRNNKYQLQNGANQFTDQRQAEREQLARGLAATIARRFAEDDAREAAIRKSQ